MTVMEGVRQGWHDQKIASELGLKLSTVKTHLVNIYQKLGVHGRTEALIRTGQLTRSPSLRSSQG